MKVVIGVVVCVIEVVVIHVLWYGVLGFSQSRAPAILSLAAIGGTWAVFK